MPSPLPPAPGLVGRTLVVDGSRSGMRLDLFLRERLGTMSRARVHALIRAGMVTGPPAPVKPASRVRGGLEVAIWRLLRDEAEPPAAVPVVFADDDLLVVDKPPLLAVHPDGRHVRATLTAVLAGQFATPRGKPIPGHRIDRETSGLVALGRHPEAGRRLKMAFAARRVDKEYLAVVEGHPPADRARLDYPLRLGGRHVRIQMVVAADGLAALTEVEVVGRFHAGDAAPLALLRCRLLTGRQHQIRAHLKAWGYPLVGDKIYGPDEAIFLEQVDGNGVLSAASLARLRLPRHALHAATLVLDHPISGRPLRFASPLPADLLGLLPASALPWSGPAARPVEEVPR